MALEKELINGKGVKTTYHRIDSISMVDGIEVTVKSYTDESYRQQEKERESLIERHGTGSTWDRQPLRRAPIRCSRQAGRNGRYWGRSVRAYCCRGR